MKPDSIQTTIVCNLNGLNRGQKERYPIVLEQVQELVQEIREVADGYAFRYPVDVPILLLLAEFINLEIHCCSFLHFTLDVETEDGPGWLAITGPDGVKEFLRTEFVLDGAS